MRKPDMTEKQINSIKELRAWMFILALNLAWIIPCAVDYTNQEPVEEVTEETVEDIIHWKQEDTEEVFIEEVKVETVTEPIEDIFYDVPLSKEVQMHIINECEKHNISPAIIMALIEVESDFDAKATSPHGAKGLMQVVPKWHSKRMERLGCTDLHDELQNVTVGIDYIAYLKEVKADLYWVLMAYNEGMDKANERLDNEDYSEYAIRIVEIARELE